MKKGTLFYCTGNILQAGGGATVAKNILKNYPFTPEDILCVSAGVDIPDDIKTRVKVVILNTPRKRIFLELYNQFIAPFILVKFNMRRVICLDSIIPIIYWGRIDVFYQMRMFYFEELDSFSKKIKNWLGKMSIRKAHKVFVASKDHKMDLVRHLKINEQKVVVAYLGADHQTINDIEAATIDEPFFLFVSILRPYKNLHRLIDAYILLSNTYKDYEIPNLIVIGSSPNYKGQHEYIEKITKKINDAKLEYKVKLVGAKPFEEVISILKSAQAMIFPTLFEGFGLPLLESMSARTPVITSDRNSLPEIGGDTVEYIDPENTESIVAAMKKVLDKEYNHEKIEEAYLRAKTFNWTNTVQTLFEND